MMRNDAHLETRAVHSGMAGLRESGGHVPPIDLSTTFPLASVESESSSGSSADQLRTVESLERSVTTVRNGMRQVAELLAKIANVPDSPEISQKLALLGPKFDELSEIAPQLSSTPQIQSDYSDATAYLRARYDAEIASRVP